MSEITLYNDSASQMSVMALGKAINWNPKTTLNVSEKEAEILLKYSHIKKYEDISSNNGELINILKKEIEILKLENEELKKKFSNLEENSSDKEDIKVKTKGK
jgi:hypothetical protein